MADRETLLSETFVEIADTLVDEFDVVDVLTTLASRCVALFDVDEAGLMLAAAGRLQVVASSSHTMRSLELFEVRHDEGPCVDCYRDGLRVECDDVGDAQERWPTFAVEAMKAGIGSAFAIPMRLRDQTIGSLNLLRSATGGLTESDFAAAQAMADVATIGILQHRLVVEHKVIAGQLQSALQSRIVIEQAKGIVGATAGLTMEESFLAMRRFARNHNLKLMEVATGLVKRTLATRHVVGSSRRVGL